MCLGEANTALSIKETMGTLQEMIQCRGFPATVSYPASNSSISSRLIIFATEKECYTSIHLMVLLQLQTVTKSLHFSVRIDLDSYSMSELVSRGCVYSFLASVLEVTVPSIPSEDFSNQGSCSHLFCL